MRRSLAVLSLVILQTAVCGATEPGDAFSGDWLVERIDGKGPAASHDVTMRVTSDGRVAGHAPCNAFSARFRLSGDRVDFEPGMTTRMFCGPELMRQEQRFLSIFSGGAKWRVTGDRLGLKSDNGLSIEAIRTEKNR